MTDWEDDEEWRQMLRDRLAERDAWQRRRRAVFVPIAIALGIVALILIWIFWLRKGRPASGPASAGRPSSP